MVDTMDTTKNLEILGLDSDEITCYLKMLEYDYSTPITKISKDTRIPRSTVYRICEELVSKKFASWTIGSRGKEIVAKHPQKLDFLIEEKKAEVKDTKSALTHLQKSLINTHSSLPKTQVRYYKGKEGLKQLIWNSLQAEGDLFGYSEFGRVENVGRKFYDRYVKEFRTRKIKDRVITNQRGIEYINQHVINPEEKHQIDQENLKIIDEQIFYVSGDTSIYNNIYVTSYWNKGEVVGVEIENEEIVKLHRSIFDILWGIAEPINEFL